MKRNFKGFALGFISACLMITPIIAFADTIQVSLNTVNIDLNATQVAAKGQSYILADGSAVPYSLNYNGTVYLPIRKVSELVGKDISYDGSTSTISISDQKSETEVPETVVDPEDEAAADLEENKDKPENPLANPSNTSTNGKEESGFAVINSFNTMLNSSGVQVNKMIGYMDGTACSMITSKKDMIQYTKTAPALYEIKYSNNVITDMDLISPDKEDTVKAASQTSTIEGSKGTYSLDSNVKFYLINTDNGGSYSVTAGSVKAGYKVYLYNTNGTGGYDVAIIAK